MKLKHARKNTVSISLTKNSIVMIIMLIVIVLATMAWFTLSRYSEAVNVVVGTEDTLIIRFAMPEEDGSYPTNENDYFNYLNFQDQMGENKVDKFTQEVTGDGINFVIPEFKSGIYPLEVDPNKAGTNATANKDYVSLTFYVRSTKENLFIEKDSYIDTGESPLTRNLYNTNETTAVESFENASGYGEFSRNAIAGAIRVSLLDVMNVSDPTQDNLKYLWIPRPDLSLVKNNDEYTLFKGVTAGASYKHTGYVQNGTKTGLEEYTTPDDKLLLPMVRENPDESPIFSEDVKVEATPVEVVMNKKAYYMYKFTVNMWLEGSDPESSNPLNGGEFQLHMNFTAKDN